MCVGDVGRQGRDLAGDGEPGMGKQWIKSKSYTTQAYAVDTYRYSLAETAQCYFGLNVVEIDSSMADSNLDHQYACREYFAEHS